MTVMPYVQSSERDGVAVVSPVGEFDISTVDMLRSVLLDAIGPTTNRLVVDLAGVTFLDSLAIGVLVSAAGRVNDSGGWLRVVAPSPNVRKVLHITRLDTVFGLYDTVDEAVQHQAPGAAVEAADLV